MDEMHTLLLQYVAPLFVAAISGFVAYLLMKDM